MRAEIEEMAEMLIDAGHDLAFFRDKYNIDYIIRDDIDNYIIWLQEQLRPPELFYLDLDFLYENADDVADFLNDN